VEEDEDFTVHLNPESRTILRDSRVEPSVASDPADTTYQFERTGYFVQDAVDSKPEHLVFNRIVTLRDGWAKVLTAAARRAESAQAEPTPSRSEDGASSVRAGHEGVESGRDSDGAKPPATDPRPEDPKAASRYDRLREEHGMAESEASVLAQDVALFGLFDEGSKHTADATGLAKWVVNEVPRVLENRPADALLFGGRELARLVELVSKGEVSGRAARDVLAVLAEEGGDPDAVVEARGLGRVSDASTLQPLVARLVEAHPTEAQGYRDGKTGLLGFFVGQVMKETNGAADPEVTQNLLREALTGSGEE
jgi:glutaminyl-tRNA synthetase